MVRPELFRESRLIRPAGDRRHAKSHVGGKLHSQVPKPANALHGHKVPGPGRRTTQGVVGGESRTKQRRGVDGTQILRDGDQSAGNAQHDLGIAAIVVDPGYWLIAAIDEITPTT